METYDNTSPVQERKYWWSPHGQLCTPTKGTWGSGGIGPCINLSTTWSC